MATFYALGKYTTQGFQGFIKDPKVIIAKIIINISKIFSNLVCFIFFIIF